MANIIFGCDDLSLIEKPTYLTIHQVQGVKLVKPTVLPTVSSNIGVGKIEKELMEMRARMNEVEERLQKLEDW